MTLLLRMIILNRDPDWLLESVTVQILGSNLIIHHAEHSNPNIQGKEVYIIYMYIFKTE